MNLPFRFMVRVVSGWLNRHQQAVTNYLCEEKAVLIDQLGDRPSLSPTPKGFGWLVKPRSSNAELCSRSLRSSPQTRSSDGTVDLSPRNGRSARSENEGDHQGIGNKLINGADSLPYGEITSNRPLGGMLNFTYRKAA
jgi:hypothetical protein